MPIQILVGKWRLNLASLYSPDEQELGDFETNNVLMKFKFVGKDHPFSQIWKKSGEWSWSLLA